MILESAVCLTLALYYEARDQPIDGQRAVAEVVLNRVADPRWPDTVCEVVYEDRGPKAHDCQFSFTCDGLPDDPPAGPALRSAAITAVGALVAPSEGLGTRATHYHALSVAPAWRHDLDLVGKIGDHIFYEGY